MTLILTIFLCCALPLSSGHQLTREQFEAAFVGPKAKELLRAFPHSSYLFTFHGEQPGEDTQLVPIKECAVLLRKRGKATVNQQCGEALQKYKPNDGQSVFVVYRCFKNDDSGDYELSIAPIEKIEQESSKWNIYFTAAKEEENCRAKWSSDQASRAVPLDKQQYEEAFEHRELFTAHPYFTYIFSLTKTQQWSAIPGCYAWLWEENKGIIHPNCFELLSGDNRQVDDLILESLLLPLRCYLKADPKNYELQNATINAIKFEEISTERKEHFIYFTTKEDARDHCQPIWGKAFRKAVHNKDEL